MIADIMKKIKGVSGVKYKSFYGFGNNIALWNCENAFEYHGSEVYLNYCSNNGLINLKDRSVIDNGSMFKKQIETDIFKGAYEANRIYKNRIDKSKSKK